METHSLCKLIKKYKGAGEMAEKLRALPEDLALAPSIHLGAHELLETPVPQLPSGLRGYCMMVAHPHTQAEHA